MISRVLLFPVLAAVFVSCGVLHYFSSFKVAVNVPKPHEMVAKFIVHVSQCESQGKENTNHIVKAMLATAPLMTHSSADTAVPDLWAGSSPSSLLC
jgi:hypothetical protein